MKPKLSVVLPIPRRWDMVDIIFKTVNPIHRTEIIPFHKSTGRECAEDVISHNTLPNYPVSRFDGIAVRYEDFEKGIPDTSHWQAGKEYVYSNTGVAMPEGYDTVIPIENVTIRESGIDISKAPEFKGDIVNGTGGSMRKGELIIKKGEVISPAHVGLFASAGALEINVLAKPRIGIISTGDELIPPTKNIPAKKNVESNSYMIAAYLEEWNAEPKRYPIVKDEPALLKKAVENAIDENDAVIIIAGSSLGTKDYTQSILNELGEVIVPELAHGPGRKSSLSVVHDKPVLGVAGPPLGAQITCDLYLSPFVSALSDKPNIDMLGLEVISDDAFSEYDVDFCERIHVYRRGDEYHIRSIFAHKTTRAQMQRLSNGNFYRIAGTSLEPGDTALIELLCPIEFIPDKDMLPEIIAKDGE